MTEKRFTLHNRGLQGQFIKDTGKIMMVEDVVELLNELWEELVELKNKQIKSIGENKQLKQQNEHLEKQIKCITQSLQNELNNYGFR